MNTIAEIVANSLLADGDKTELIKDLTNHQEILVEVVDSLSYKVYGIRKEDNRTAENVTTILRIYAMMKILAAMQDDTKYKMYSMQQLCYDSQMESANKMVMWDDTPDDDAPIEDIPSWAWDYSCPDDL